MRVTRATRESAILICDAHASSGWSGDIARGYRWASQELGLDHPALLLALWAWGEVRRLEILAGVPAWTPASDAEAAQMLREGARP